MNIKENDVYSFVYNEMELTKMIYPYHCFDGTLIARKCESGLLLVDTYWSSDNKYFTIEQALSKGKLTFICNLDEVDSIMETEQKYYDSSNIIVLYIHGGYRNKYYINKGTKRSKDAMLAYVNEKLSDKISQISSINHDIDRLKASIKAIESGNLELYI